jgi:hypothetical protein
MVVLGMCPSWLATRRTMTGGNARPDAAILTQQGASMCPTRPLRASASSSDHGGGQRHQAHRGSGAMRMDVWGDDRRDHHRGSAWFDGASADLGADRRCASIAGDGAWRQGPQWQFIKIDTEGEVIFLRTSTLTNQVFKHLSNVNRAYFGLRPQYQF